MMEATVTNHWIDRFVDQELESGEREVFLKSLKNDHNLRNEWIIENRINQLLDEPDVLDLMVKIKTASQQPVTLKSNFSSFLVAASVLCLLTFGFLHYVIRTDPAGMVSFSSHGIQQEQGFFKGLNFSFQDFLEFRKSGRFSPESRREIGSAMAIAASYKPLPEFELLAGIAMRNSPVKLMLPGLNARKSIADEIVFATRSISGEKNASLVIMNNRGERVKEFAVNPWHNEIRFRAQELGKGLFYWKLTGKRGILYFGKISIH